MAEFYVAQLVANPSLQGFGADRVVMSPQELRALLTASAEQDYVDAQVTLAMWLADKTDGVRTPIETFVELGVIGDSMTGSIAGNSAQSASWFERAAEHGDIFAQAVTAARYATGVGVPKDNARALFWITLALREPPAAGIVPMATMYTNPMNDLRKSVAAQLSAQERTAVATRVAQWQPKPPPHFDTHPETPYEQPANRFGFARRF